MIAMRKTWKTFLVFVLFLGCIFLSYINVSNVKLNIQFGQADGNGNLCTCSENSSHRESLIHPPATRSIATSQGARVIIVAFGRSGSSFLGGIFNSHPDVFFIYEPINQLNKIVNRYSKDYLHGVEDVMHSFLNCNFKDDAFLQILSSHGSYRASSRPLVSPPFCQTSHEISSNFISISGQKWKLCNESISANALNKSCGKYKYRATKILLECLHPADLTWLVKISSLPINVLYLVRDPRAILHSRKRLGWVVPTKRFKEGLANGEVAAKVKKVCDAMELNLGAVLLEPKSIKLIRYEDMATNPEVTSRDLFSQLRIPLSSDVFRWVHNKTHGPAKLSALSLSRQANVSINSWREQIDHQFLQIIETRCARVMKYLGYIPTNGSKSMLGNLRRPLYLEKMRDLKETYQWPA